MREVRGEKKVLLGSFVFAFLRNVFNAINRFFNGSFLLLLVACVFCGLFQFYVYKCTDSYSFFPDSYTYTTEYRASFHKGEVDSFRTPVYPLLAVLIKTVGGEEQWFENIVTVQKVLFFLSVILVFLSLTRLVKSKLIIFFSTLLYGCCPSLILWNSAILTESLSIFLFSVLLLFTVLLLRKNSLILSLAVSLVLAVLILTRPAAIYLLPIYALYWIVKIVIAEKKKRLGAIINSCGLLVCISAVLLFCTMMYFQHGSFGLSSVSSLNTFSIYLDGHFYNHHDNPEQIEFLNGVMEANNNNGLDAKNQYFLRYGEDEVDRLYENMKRGTSKMEMIGYFAEKFLNTSTLDLSIVYVPMRDKVQLFSLWRLLKIFYPFSFPIVYWVVFLAMITSIYIFVSKRKVDWILLWLSAAIFGNIATAVIGAPYETARLCVLCIPAFLILLAYILSNVKYLSKRGISSKIAYLKPLSSDDDKSLWLAPICATTVLVNGLLFFFFSTLFPGKDAIIFMIACICSFLLFFDFILAKERTINWRSVLLVGVIGLVLSATVFVLCLLGLLSRRLFALGLLLLLICIVLYFLFSVRKHQQGYIKKGV